MNLAATKFEIDESVIKFLNELRYSFVLGSKNKVIIFKNEEYSNGVASYANTVGKARKKRRVIL